MTTPETTARGYACDAEGCPDEADIGNAGRRLCYTHALAAANADRRARGLLPIVFDEEGERHVQQ